MIFGMQDEAPDLDPDILRDLARDLMVLHEKTSLSLDHWESARTFVESYYGEIEENYA